MLTHYRAAFDLLAGDNPAPRDAVSKVVERWINEVESSNNPPLTDGKEPGSRLTREFLELPDASLIAYRHERAIQNQGQVWVTEIGIRARHDSTTCYIANGRAALRSGEKTLGRPRPPRLVTYLLTEFTAIAGEPLSATPWQATEEEASRLIGFVGSRSRQRPVVVVTVDPYSERPLLDPMSLQERTMGLAHIVLLNKRACLRLKEGLSRILRDEESARRWSVYNGAARLYWPGLDATDEESSPFDHPIWEPRLIREDNDRAANDLARRVIADANLRMDSNWLDVAAVRTAQLREQRLAFDSTKSDIDFTKKYAGALEADNEEAWQRITDLEWQLSEANSRARRAESEAQRKSFIVRQLESALEGKQNRNTNNTADEDRKYKIVSYGRGVASDRDCLEELLNEYPNEADEICEDLEWLGSPSNWSSPSPRLTKLGNDLFEFRISKKDHWFRLFVRRVTRLSIVVVLNCYAKQQNKLDPNEQEKATTRARELFGA